MFDEYLTRWHLTPDGEPIVTRSSSLLPVRFAGEPAMLKIAREEEERRGAAVLAWWGGEGAARVLAHDDTALLMERAVGERSLIEMARSGRDDEATGVLCAAVAPLHARRDRPPAGVLVPLPRWFRELEPAADRFGGVLRDATATAHALLAEPRDAAPLHGDLHHGNVLDFGPRGWLAIDPKGLLGERGFDFANILCNPDLELSTAPGRLARQVGVVADATGLDQTRLLRWVLAYAGLSAAWTLGDGDDATHALTIARIAAAELAANHG
jgi:streptomycin 6-kinase